VSDYNTNRLIDAKKAYWVVGGNKSGIMTKRAKWAFEKMAHRGSEWVNIAFNYT
jgi:nitrous oxide reductase accessory protein NosL